MPDLKESFTLPSEGKIYNSKVEPTYSLRAPRLIDKAIGDMRSKLKIQSEVLYNCLEPKPTVHPYDWHTSDFTAANLAQRKIARGRLMKLKLRCPFCGNTQETEVDLDLIEEDPVQIPLDLKYKTRSDDEVELRFFTPRILDQIKTNISKFKSDFPDSDQDVSLQETCRAIIVSVNGESLQYTKMTNWLLNCYEADLVDMIDKVTKTSFGPNLIKQEICKNPKCRKPITFSVSPDNG